MIRSFLILFTATLLLTGCYRPSYINVPNDGSDSAINGPNWDTTVKLEKAGLAYLLGREPILGDIALRLPNGTTEATAFDVSAALSAYNVFPEGHTPTDEFQLIEVRKIQARGGRARLDVIRPGTIRPRELVEVHLEWKVLEGWVPDYIRPRNIDIDRIDPLLLAAPAPEPKKPAFQEVQPPEEAAEDVEEAAEAVEEATDAAEEATE